MLNAQSRRRSVAITRAICAVSRRAITVIASIGAVYGAATASASLAASPPLRPGQEVVLGEYFEVWPGVCQGMARPVVIVTQRPTLGELIVQGGQAPKEAGGTCGRVQTGTSRIIYKAGSKPGDDTYAWEVKYQHVRHPPVKIIGRQTIIAR